ncbi:hypothetical protein [Nonomuraea sp. NPDC049625]|uniref:hypothetical protein n=1 Tax=Nonomuraea sp. NPDC049625 TaxID=3155775 RepID=UPI003442275E
MDLMIGIKPAPGDEMGSVREKGKCLGSPVRRHRCSPAASVVANVFYEGNRVPASRSYSLTHSGRTAPCLVLGVIAAGTHRQASVVTSVGERDVSMEVQPEVIGEHQPPVPEFRRRPGHAGGLAGHQDVPLLSPFEQVVAAPDLDAAAARANGVGPVRRVDLLAPRIRTG